MFRFTIRDIVLLTLVVAVAVGWWADRTQLLKQSRSLQALQVKLQMERAQLETDLSILRLEVLRERELQGKVILPSGPIR
jgi:hypothetical protein